MSDLFRIQKGNSYHNVPTIAYVDGVHQAANYFMEHLKNYSKLLYKISHWGGAMSLFQDMEPGQKENFCGLVIERVKLLEVELEGDVHVDIADATSDHDYPPKKGVI